MPEAKYIVVKDVLTKEEAAHLVKRAYDNLYEHPFKGFQGFSPLNDEWYHHPKIQKMLADAEQYFKDNYLSEGKEIVFDRQHGNIMNEGAELWAHKDVYDPSDPGGGPGNALVCNLFLTDDYEGGELVFKDLNESIIPSVGDAIIFPGYLLNHGVNKVKGGSRINIISHFFLIDKSN